MTATNTAAARSTESYAADVAASRARMMATLDSLQQRLEPRALIGTVAESAIVSLIGPGASILAMARRLIQRHPLAVAAGGLALGITLLSRNKLAHAKVDLGEAYEPYSDFEDDYSVASGDTRDGLGAFGDVEDKPLTAVLAGLAAGALIGALFPGTTAEDRLMGAGRAKLSRAAQAAIHAARSEFSSQDAA